MLSCLDARQRRGVSKRHSFLRVPPASNQANADVAFVPVPANRWHASPQLRETYGVTPDAPEANTGALVIRRTPKALSLLQFWGWRRAGGA